MPSVSDSIPNPYDLSPNPKPLTLSPKPIQLKIAVLGTRGFPDVQGGVERHCENLYPELVKLGCEVTVFGRKPYLKTVEVQGIGIRDKGNANLTPQPSTINPNPSTLTPNPSTLNFNPSTLSPHPITNYKGVEMLPINCPKNKFFETFYHTFKGVIAVRMINPDILHIHAIGPSLYIPLARLLGLKVVMTNHGPDYARQKWNWFAKQVLKLGELLGSKFANKIICISHGIADNITKKYKRNPAIIPNGVVIPEILPPGDTLKRFGLEKGKYILAVGRFVPEKGFHDLVEAYELAHSSWLMAHRESKENFKPQIKSLDSIPSSYELSAMSYKLAIVGDADHEDKYSQELKAKAKENPNVVLTGFLTGKPLQEIYSNAGIFVLPSYYEGLPIVLLEAMSYGLSCIVSDIPANREVPLDDNRYFKPGDINCLSQKIYEFLTKPFTTKEKTDQIALIKTNYIADSS